VDGRRSPPPTRDLHDKIEANPHFCRLMAPDLTRAEYGSLLARIYGHHAAAEAALAEAAPLLPPGLALEHRLRRTALLANDLAQLGLAQAAIAALPRCQVAACATAEEAWGQLCVLEGLVLGGQLIARHLAATLALGPQTGAGGMVPHGTETGVLWRGFKQALEDAADSGTLDSAHVVTAARRAFATLDAWVAGMAWRPGKPMPRPT
jgi:heme oxygenase (biliverdin-IX-beta and delta-forming)